VIKMARHRIFNGKLINIRECKDLPWNCSTAVNSNEKTIKDTSADSIKVKVSGPLMYE
jgi:hypothetical protein